LSVWYWGRADLSTYLSLPFLFELLAFNSVSLTIKEELRLEVFLVKRQKLASTKVCDVGVELEVELELLAESSFFEQEMRVRLKRDMKIM
tara:strand:+ start:472 stop:741 length:270 start_codon:yes stop_codon:yes gene_type:complete